MVCQRPLLSYMHHTCNLNYFLSSKRHHGKCLCALPWGAKRVDRSSSGVMADSIESEACAMRHKLLRPYSSATHPAM